jgi:hypothetical protein
LPNIFTDASQDIIQPSIKPRRTSRNQFVFLAGENNDVRNSNTKPVVPVEVVRVVPVAVRTAGIPMIVVERAAAQNTILWMRPS